MGSRRSFAIAIVVESPKSLGLPGLGESTTRFGRSWSRIAAPKPQRMAVTCAPVCLK